MQNWEGLDPCFVENDKPEVMNLLYCHKHLSESVIVKAEGAKLKL
jgi:hypothetical protein